MSVFKKIKPESILIGFALLVFIFCTNITVNAQNSITVTVSRPYLVSVENDIFATVEVDNIYTSNMVDTIIDFTQTPLIPSGESNAQFEFKVAEDGLYTLKISNITGDDRLFDYYCYVYTLESPADESQLRQIRFSDDDISFSLLRCNNVSGTVVCERDDLEFTAFATTYNHLNRKMVFSSDVVNGKFSFKIPDDSIWSYTLDIQTKIGKKSYYVSDGMSSNNEEDATEIDFVREDDKAVVIEYIPHNPTQPIEISNNNWYDWFDLKNISDYTIEGFSAYVAYYDVNGKLLSYEKTEKNQLTSGTSFTLSRDASTNYKIKKIKVFAWGNEKFSPLGNVCEMSVNQPSAPEQDISIFHFGDNSAVINCQEQLLNKAPEEINGTMYLSASDFEKLGYIISSDRRYVYIENGRVKYRFVSGEYTTDEFIDDYRTDSYEIAAPVLNDGEILIPVVVICDLFKEETGFYNEGKTLIINMPFSDIDYNDPLFEALFDMYNRGLALGYEDGTFRPDGEVLRSEAAMNLSWNMGHVFDNYEFECSDVPADHWAQSFIGICINENVFDLENDMFRPDDCITVKEAIIAVLRMKKQNYENYLEVAKEKGLFANIDEENIDRDITRGEMIQLLYNALKIN